MKVDPLLEPLLAGDRRALAQAITLIESTRSDHRERADLLLGALLPHAGKSVRLGITGVPGVGKSTFIERFGLSLLEQGRSLAVLAIDPSSKRDSSSMRVLSPRIEPPPRLDDGSMASTASERPCSRRDSPKRSMKVDLPTPGTPVMPSRTDLPARGSRAPSNASARSR